MFDKITSRIRSGFGGYRSLLRGYMYKRMFHRRLLTTILTGVTASLLIADANESVPLQEQGSVIQLNGQAWAGRWIKRVEEGRLAIFLQDDWLSGALGVDLMDSDRADQQKLRWFSVPFFAPVTFDKPVQHRFLDVQNIAPQWRTEIAGSVLKISTPDSLVQAVRRSKQEWGDRIVIDLSQRTPWQIQTQGSTVSLAMAADLAPGLTTGQNKDKGNLIESVDLQSQGKQAILKIQTKEALQPDIQTLSDPPRITVDFRRDYVPPDQSIVWANGLQRKQQIIVLPTPATKVAKENSTPAKQNPKPVKENPKALKFLVTSLLIDTRQPGLSMRPIWSNPNGMQGTSSLREIAELWQATAAINGGFFNRDRKLPVGPIRESNRWMAGPVLNRGAIAWNAEGEILIDRLLFSEEIFINNSQKSIVLSNLNSGYVQKGLARYTANWGAAYTPLNDGEVIIVVQGDRVVSQTKAGKSGQGNFIIPPTGYLLIVRQSPELVSQLIAGAQIKGKTTIKPNTFAGFPNILGAGPILLKDSVLALDAKLEQFRPPFDKQGAARSAIATTKEQGKIILATIHAATPEGSSPSLAQTAEILKKLGAVNALNLDGGGSTTIYLGGNVLNRAPGNVGPVHNGIGIFISSPTTPPTPDQF
jgi:hypothetical protein